MQPRLASSLGASRLSLQAVKSWRSHQAQLQRMILIYTPFHLEFFYMNTVFRSKKMRVQTLENVGKLPNLQALCFSTVTETLGSPSKGSYSSCLQMMHLRMWNLEHVNSRTRWWLSWDSDDCTRIPSTRSSSMCLGSQLWGSRDQSPWGSLAILLSHIGELDPQWET